MAGTIRQKKGFYCFIASNGNKYKLTLKEKKFSDLYLQLNGNGAKAAFEVYDCNNLKTAAVVASENLTKLNVSAYISSTLERDGFNEDNIRKQLLFLINQFSDLSAKNKAIDTFYKLTGKYKETQVRVNIFEGWTNEELEGYAVHGIVPERFSTPN